MMDTKDKEAGNLHCAPGNTYPIPFYGPDFLLIMLRQAEIDLNAFQWRYRELEDVCRLVEDARRKILAMRSEIDNRADGDDEPGR